MACVSSTLSSKSESSLARLVGTSRTDSTSQIYASLYDNYRWEHTGDVLVSRYAHVVTHSCHGTVVW